MNAAATTEELGGSGLKAIADGFRGLGAARLAAMGLVSFGMFCMLALLMFHGGGEGRMALLYGDLDMREAGQMADLLDKAHISHTIGAAGDQILVPESDIPAARLLLAKANLPSEGTVGDEIFDRGDSLTSSQFEQDINRTRALEGELSRSIRMIDGVKGARVHLVLPHRELFSAEQQSAQASVLLTMRGPARLDAEATQAILNLVSAAVPGLRPQGIAIIDNRGNVLVRAGNPTSTDLTGNGTADELRQSMEARLSHQVEEMLDASLGSDKVRAEASVTLDMSQVNETSESFNPDQQVLRSQQSTSDKSHNTQAQQAATVSNNLPNADAGAPQSGSTDDRSSETNNYEIGKTVRTLVQAAPRVERLSLAVLVDGVVTLDKSGKPVWQPRSAEELARITALVKSAIGFDAKRGDSVTVETMRFTAPDTGEVDRPAGMLASLNLQQTDLVRLAQTALLGLVVLAIGLFVFRPMVVRLVPTQGKQIGTTAANAVAGGGGAAIAHDGASRALVTAAGRAGGNLLTHDGDDAMTQVNHVDGAVTASALAKLAELVDRYPEESLALVRTWLSEEPA